MKIEAVKMMRNIRDKMSNDVKNMSWDKEQEYLNSRIKTFDFLIKKEQKVKVEK